MNLSTEPYLVQKERWPQAGRHILAQFDAESIIVYQAYQPSIGHFAAQHQAFGGEFSFTRMSWVKTNFLWMMYRSGWGTKPGQEVTLAIRIRRKGFDQLLSEAVHSTFDPSIYPDQQAWAAAVAGSSVRLQWDPDHNPGGAKQERRAIQLGLRGTALARYARDWLIKIEDISAFVAQQREHVQPRSGYSQLQTPHEEIYAVGDASTAQRLGLAAS
ncbi:DUF4291 domain-containing protein [Chloroflexia bacterium SDU3-3]|nr:DUF4291 domain-containing protein [Chloroflexia bacterium SDU3-3]